MLVDESFLCVTVLHVTVNVEPGLFLNVLLLMCLLPSHITVAVVMNMTAVLSWHLTVHITARSLQTDVKKTLSTLVFLCIVRTIFLLVIAGQCVARPTILHQKLYNAVVTAMRLMSGPSDALCMYCCYMA